MVGRIPASALYATGMNVLNWWPQPTLALVPGQAYNYENTRPEERLIAYQPALRVDYQPLPRLRASVKYTGWIQRKQTINGSIRFDIEPRLKKMLLEGLDEIGLTLAMDAKIAAFQKADRAKRPWIYF